MELLISYLIITVDCVLAIGWCLNDIIFWRSHWVKKILSNPCIQPLQRRGILMVPITQSGKGMPYITEFLPFMTSYNLCTIFVCLRNFQCSSASCIWFIAKSWTCTWSQNISSSRWEQHYECQSAVISVNSFERFATNWTYYSYFRVKLAIS